MLSGVPSSVQLKFCFCFTVREIEGVNKPQQLFLGKCVRGIGACDFIACIFLQLQCGNNFKGSVFYIYIYKI